MVNKYLKSIATAASVFMASNAAAEEAPQTCKSLPFGEEFIQILASKPANLFTDPNHNDPAFINFLENNAVKDCFNQAGISHLFIEYSTDREELFEQLRTNQITKDQFVTQFFEGYSSIDDTELQRIVQLAAFISSLSESNIAVLAGDDQSSSNLAIMVSIFRTQGFKLWSTLLPEEERRSFLNWTLYGHIADEETKARHLQLLSDNSDTDTFRNGQRMLDNATVFNEQGAVKARLDDRSTFAYILSAVRNNDIGIYALLRGEGHFSDSDYSINNLVTDDNSNIFCLRSEFTQTPTPDICEYTINVSSYSFTPHMP